MPLVINNFWGAETGGLEETFAAAGSGAVLSTNKHSGSYSYIVAFVNPASHRIDLSPFETIASGGSNICLGFWLFPQAFDAGGNPIALTDGTNTDFSITNTATGALELRDSTGTIRGTTGNITEDAWNFIELYLERANSGAFKLYVNGSLGAEGSGYDFNAITGTPLLRLVGTKNTSVGTLFDDIYFMSGATSEADRLGQSKVLRFDSGRNSAIPHFYVTGTESDATLNSGVWINANFPGVLDADLVEYTSSNAQSGGVHGTNGPFSDLQNDIVAAKGIWKMARDGGGGTDHFGIIGKNSTSYTAPELKSTNFERTADFDPSTVEAFYFHVTESNLPLTTEYGSIGIEKSAGGQNFSCSAIVYQLLHVDGLPAGGSDGTSTGTSTVTGVSGAINKTNATTTAFTTLPGIVNGSTSITDAAAAWTNDANAFDGSEATYASCVTDNNNLVAIGTDITHPTSGVSQVRYRFLSSYNVDPGWTTVAMFLGEQQLSLNTRAASTPIWSAWATLTTPTGGWNSDKVDSLEARAYRSSGTGEIRLYEIELEITYVYGAMATVTGVSGAVIPTEGTSAGTATVTGVSGVVVGTEFSWPATFLDTFTAANGTLLSTHTPDLNPYSWVAAVGALSSWEIQSNRLYRNDTAWSTVTLDTQRTSYVQKCTVEKVENDTPDLVLQYADVDNNLVLRFYNTYFAIRKSLVGTSSSPYGTYPTTMPGTWDIEVRRTGDNFVVTANGTEIFNFTDTSFSGNTKVGMRITTGGIANSTWFDNYEIVESPNAATVTGISARIESSSFAAAGTSIVTGIGTSTTGVTFTEAGTSTTSIDTARKIVTVASAAGTSTVTGESADAGAGTLATAAGTSTVTGNSATIYASSYVVASSSTITAFSAPKISVTLSTEGTSTVNADAAVIWLTDTSAIGEATSSADSGSIRTAAYAVSALASVTGVVSNYIIATNANAAGSSATSGLSSYTFSVTATSSGTATLDWQTNYVISTDLSSTGIATVTGESARIVGTIAAATGTSTVVGFTSAAYEFEAFRFRNDNGTEATATWKAGQDVSILEDINVIVRLRTLLDATGSPDSSQVTLQYRKVGESDNDWRNV